MFDESMFPEMFSNFAKMFGNRQYPDVSLITHINHDKFQENCFDCILKLKKNRKKKLEEFFSSFLESKYEKYHHETVFRLHSLSNHPEQW